MSAPRRVQPPPWLGDVAKAVEARIAALLDDEIARWSTLDPELALPLESLRGIILAGGKRLRPAFSHWAFVGTGGDPADPAIVDAGAALELLHTFALVHDDVMDGSLRRHGLDAVHVQFERAHSAAARRGEGRRFGEGVAILVGDLAFVYADRLLAGADRQVLDVWTELRIEVNVGQYLDLLGTARGTPTVGAASRICQYKSGKYTIERPLHLGSALAGGLTPTRAAALTAYGMPLGEAFQLVDDLLGAFGDAGVLGKPVGDDLREGKPTRLVAIALERATGADRVLLAERVGARDLAVDEVAAIQSVLESTGARSEVEATVERMTDVALAAAEAAPLTADARAGLADLARYVADRDR